jgi:hypothetical protein
MGNFIGTINSNIYQRRRQNYDVRTKLHISNNISVFFVYSHKCSVRGLIIEVF